MAAPRRLVLLAAGLGRRLGAPKPLVRLRGRPLAWYPLSVAHLLGASEAIIVTRRELADELAALAESVMGRGSATVILNEEPWRENGWSLVLASEALGAGEEALVSMSDHVYSPLVALAAVSAGGCYAIACDTEPRWVDVAEATKVSASASTIHAVGKALQRWLCVDAGVHVLRAPEKLPWQARLLGDVVPLNGLVSTLAARLGCAAPGLFSSQPWTEIDTPEELREAEQGARAEVVEHVLDWLHG